MYPKKIEVVEAIIAVKNLILLIKWYLPFTFKRLIKALDIDKNINPITVSITVENWIKNDPKERRIKNNIIPIVIERVITIEVKISKYFCSISKITRSSLRLAKTDKIAT